MTAPAGRRGRLPAMSLGASAGRPMARNRSRESSATGTDPPFPICSSRRASTSRSTALWIYKPLVEAAQLSLVMKRQVVDAFVRSGLR